jgi:hypothetical protein
MSFEKMSKSIEEWNAKKKKLKEALDEAFRLGWYMSDDCDDWIVLSPLSEKDDRYTLTQIYIEWGKPAPKDCETLEVTSVFDGTIGFKTKSTTKPIPPELIPVVERITAAGTEEKNAR